MSSECWRRLEIPPEYMLKGSRNNLIAASMGGGSEVEYARFPRQATSRSLHISGYSGLCIHACLGFRTPEVMELQQWPQLAARVVELTLAYFFDPWREQFRDWSGDLCDAGRARRELPWIDEYREGLMWAALLDRVDDIRRLAEWPGADLPEQEGTWDRTPADKQYQLALAAYLRGESLSSGGAADAIDRVRASKPQRPKMLLAALLALADGDGPGFGRAIAEEARRFHLTEFGRSIGLYIDVEGTTLWHLGRLKHLPLPKLSGNLGCHIIASTA